MTPSPMWWMPFSTIDHLPKDTSTSSTGRTIRRNTIHGSLWQVSMTRPPSPLTGNAATNQQPTSQQLGGGNDVVTRSQHPYFRLINSQCGDQQCDWIPIRRSAGYYISQGLQHQFPFVFSCFYFLAHWKLARLQNTAVSQPVKGKLRKQQGITTPTGSFVVEHRHHCSLDRGRRRHRGSRTKEPVGVV